MKGEALVWPEENDKGNEPGDGSDWSLGACQFALGLTYSCTFTSRSGPELTVTSHSKLIGIMFEGLGQVVAVYHRAASDPWHH
jgi:hypothetical protein